MRRSATGLVIFVAGIVLLTLIEPVKATIGPLLTLRDRRPALLVSARASAPWGTAHPRRRSRPAGGRAA